MLYFALTAVVSIIVGMVIGFFFARKAMVKHFEDNPPIDEKMMKTMMKQMGVNVSQKKMNQIMQTVKK